MAQRSDPIYPQLERALNLLIESSAKIDFLYSKVESKVRELDDQELARIAQRTIFLEEQLEVSVLNDNTEWKSVKDKADNLQLSLMACREKCTVLQGRIRELIDVKDTLLCQSMIERPDSNTELLPNGTRIERMIMELTVESTECSVCTEIIKKHDRIWSCKNCYNIFHLDCAVKCMEAGKTNRTWACPYCRITLNVIEGGLRYTCFCGRVQEPKSALNVTPHGCGQGCGRGCGAICHPGPCSSTVASSTPQKSTSLSLSPQPSLPV